MSESMMPPCLVTGPFGRNAHRFEARMDWVIDWEKIIAAGVDINEAYNLSAESSFSATFGRRVYVGDICTRCGLTVDVRRLGGTA
jgi:hypothetical protein